MVKYVNNIKDKNSGNGNSSSNGENASGLDTTAATAGRRGSKSGLLEVPKVYSNDYYNRRKSYFNCGMNLTGANQAYQIGRRNSNSASTTRREEIKIKQIGEYFDSFSPNEKDFILHSVMTTTPAFILEIEKNHFEKFKKEIEEKEKNEKTSFLKTLSIFQNFSFDSLFNFSEYMEYRTVPCGQTILSFNQPLDEFFIVKRGKCNVYRRLFLESHGQVQTAKVFVGQFGPGDYFGERGIIEYHGFLHIKNIEIIDKLFSNPYSDKDPIRSEMMVVAVQETHEPSIYDTILDQKDSLYPKGSSNSTSDSNDNGSGKGGGKGSGKGRGSHSTITGTGTGTSTGSSHSSASNISTGSKISNTPDYMKETISLEERRLHQKKQKESKTVELAVIALSRARLKIQNSIEYSRFEKLTQDELYCMYLESTEKKNWNRLKRRLNEDRLKEVLNDPTITESKLNENTGKERWKI